MGTTKTEIAREAGVSRTAASLVLNDAPNNISPSTQKRIIATAQKMGYLPKDSFWKHSTHNVRQQTIELGLWGSFETMEVLKDLISEFESSSGIHVGLSYTSAYKGKYTKRLKQQFTDGSPPDVFWLNDEFLKFIESGWLLDLTPYLNRDDDFDASVFPLEILKKFNHGGKVYSLPKDINVSVLYYNKDLLRQSKVEFPGKGWNWKDFLRISQELTKPQKEQFGFSYGTEWLHWIWQNGGEILDQAGEKCLIDEVESVEALQFLQDLKFRYKVVPQKSFFDDLLSVELFTTGKAAMTILPRWAIIPLRHIKEFDWDVTYLPEGRSGLITPVYLGGLCISRFTKHPEESWKLLKEMVSKKWQERIWGFIGEALPVNKFARSTRIDDLFLPPEHQNVFVDSVKYGRVPSYFNLPRDREIREVLERGISEIVLSRLDVKDACTEIKNNVDNLIRSH